MKSAATARPVARRRGIRCKVASVLGLVSACSERGLTTGCWRPVADRQVRIGFRRAVIMPRTVAESTIAHVRLLLASGVSHRQAAVIAGVGRSTVLSIASNPDFEAQREQREQRVQKSRAARAETCSLFSGPLERCPGCGGMVQMPCKGCAARDAIESSRKA